MRYHSTVPACHHRGAEVYTILAESYSGQVTSVAPLSFSIQAYFRNVFILAEEIRGGLEDLSTKHKITFRLEVVYILGVQCTISVTVLNMRDGCPDCVTEEQIAEQAGRESGALPK